jgi:hypothetical protein
MRTPDNDETQGTETQGTETHGTETTDSTDAASLLAHGFGTTGTTGTGGADSDADDAFGSGQSGSGFDTDDSAFVESYGSDEPSFLQDAGSEGDELSAFGDELSAFEFEPDYVADGDDDLDFNGDGTTDVHDGHAALEGLHDFDSESADTPGPVDDGFSE